MESPKNKPKQSTEESASIFPDLFAVLMLTSTHVLLDQISDALIAEGVAPGKIKKAYLRVAKKLDSIAQSAQSQSGGGAIKRKVETL
jgi:hypothetical protein